MALISGGKDSIYSIMKLLEEGHQLICLLHMAPYNNKEIDSYMFQSVGSEVIPYIAKCLDKPLFESTIKGKSVNIELSYTKTDNDEIEDMYELFKEALDKYPDIEAVSSGAILSTYQKNRVENICKRLNLKSLAPLWNKKVEDIIEEISEKGVKAMIVRVCSMGLNHKHIGKYINDTKDYLLQNSTMFNCAGEGGEFETIVTDCPIYKYSIQTETEIITESNDDLSPVLRVKFNNIKLIEKHN